jgi:SAM-dependent methyltransferase
MGYNVTAVDIEKNFIELIKERARRKQLTLEAIQGDFSLIHQFEQKFDAVLFFECFHHCSDHQSLIAGLDRVVAPGGKVLFAAEPITDDFPIPWGLRLDGESLWAIRKNGWLELGFKETYFRDLLVRHGWEINKSVCPETPWGVILTATRVSDKAMG